MVSNKSLLVLVVIVITIFFAGMLFSVGRIGVFSSHAQPTGKASSADGSINISVLGILSITTNDDAVINFTGCRPNVTIFSDLPLGDNVSACKGFSPDSILVRNDGNEPVNLSLNFSDWGEAHTGSFLDSLDNASWIAYRIANSSTNTSFAGGCLGSLQGNWTNVTDGSLLRACEYLLAEGLRNSVEFDIGLFVPATVTGDGDEVSITFFASPPI